MPPDSTRSLGSSGAHECDACGAVCLVFDVSFARSGQRPELGQLLEALVFVQTLKFGELFRCMACQRSWFFEKSSGRLERVPLGAEALVLRWNNEALQPNAVHLERIRQIGATEAGLYGHDRGFYRFPCAVRLRTGEEVDPALLIVTRHPPISTLYAPALLYSDVDELTCSEFALPPAVRVATTRAEEIHMGYAPTAIVTASGEHMVLNWSSDILRKPGVVSCEVELALWRVEFIRLHVLDHVHTRAALHIFCDWFSGVDDLLLGSA